MEFKNLFCHLHLKEICFCVWKKNLFWFASHLDVISMHPNLLFFSHSKCTKNSPFSIVLKNILIKIENF